MPMVVRLELDEGEVPFLEFSDQEAMMLLMERLAQQLGNAHQLGNPEYVRYARELAERDSAIYVAIFDRDELELIETVMADVRRQERELEAEEP